VPSIAAGHFAAAAALPKGAGSDAVTLLSNGKVLFLGAGKPELYNPATNAFSAAGPMVAERRNPLAAALPGGKVLVIGGDSFAGCALSNIDIVEVYNSATNTFSQINSPVVGDVYQTATSLADGTVLLTGGWTIDDAHLDGFRSSALFDPATSAFTLLGGDIQPAPGAAASLLPDHTVLFAGGLVGNDGTFTPIGTAVVYRPDHHDFVTLAGTMTVPRTSASATLLPDGRVLIVGGGTTDSWDGCSGTCLSSAETYDYRTGTFASAGTMAAPRAGHGATLLASGGVLIAGAAGTSAEVWTSGTFAATAGPMTHARPMTIAVRLPSGRVLVVGSGTADLYQP